MSAALWIRNCPYGAVRKIVETWPRCTTAAIRPAAREPREAAPTTTSTSTRAALVFSIESRTVDNSRQTSNGTTAAAMITGPEGRCDEFLTCLSQPAADRSTVGPSEFLTALDEILTPVVRRGSRAAESRP